MTFIWMDMLWLLAIVPLLIAGYLIMLSRKKKAAVRYANLPMVREAMGNTGAFRRHIPPILSILAITVMIAAVARPAAVISLASLKATIMLTMDVSGSMRATDVEPSRIEASKAAAKDFIMNQPRDVLIGITAFAGSALLVQAPTTNRDDLIAAIDRFDLQRGTNIGGGILVSMATLFPEEEIDTGGGFGGQGGFGGFGGPNPFGGPGGLGGQGTGVPLGGQTNGQPAKPKPPPVEPGSFNSAAIILLTDGAATTGPDPIEAGQVAADHGIRVFTVGFGTTAGDVVGFGGRFMRAQLDEDTLKRIADMTRGQYFHATSEQDLRKIYEALNTRRIVETKQTEITAFFAAAAAALAVLSALFSLMWFNRVL